jgi:hypothetical protein
VDACVLVHECGRVGWGALQIILPSLLVGKPYCSEPFCVWDALLRVVPFCVGCLVGWRDAFGAVDRSFPSLLFHSRATIPSPALVLVGVGVDVGVVLV